MSSISRTSILFLAVSALLCPFFAHAQAQKWKPISEDELGRWINEHNDCPADQPPYFWRLDYYDFKGDGNQEAIVVASSCMTGTAGPDIHSVFGRDASGALVELKIPTLDPTTTDNLFGNSNSDEVVENGLLVSTYGDDAARKTPPLIIKYKWNGKEFAVVEIKKTGIFKTSYDCGKAEKEVENAICHVEELAKLDADLGTLYKSTLSTLSEANRNSLRAQQRQWLTQRDKECAIYKGWVDCLSDYYEKRIEELKKLNTPPPGADHPQQ
jgi:uncharacterized protein YecT (DUF1311 family)